jgi:type I restriction enzyme S subunit
MSSEWQTLPIGEIGKVVTGKTPSTAIDHYYGGEYPFYTPSDMDGRKRLESTKRSLSTEGIDSIRGSIIEAGAVMVSCIGSDMGKVAIAANKGATNQQINTILVSQGFDPEYIYYELSTRKDELQMLATGGSAQPILNKGHFCQIEICVPPLPEQKAVAHILGTLDDKIELNRKTNETLEAMAKALFKSWFVDFDPVRAKAEGRPTGLPAEISDLFPDSFEDSELGEIPSGWRVDSIYAVASVIYGAPFSSSLFNGDGDGIPVARIRDLPGETPGVFTTEVHSKGTLILPGDVVVGMDGEFRAYLWGGEECWMNQRVCKFIPSEKSRTCFLRESILKPLMDVERSETATTVIHLGKGDIDGFRLVVPSPDVLGIFSSATTPLYEEVVAKKQQTRVLANIRDALLPKLISGEIRIPDAEKMLEEVGV